MLFYLSIYFGLSSELFESGLEKGMFLYGFFGIYSRFSKGFLFTACGFERLLWMTVT